MNPDSELSIQESSAMEGTVEGTSSQDKTAPSSCSMENDNNEEENPPTNDGPPSRLMITKMELENFKSYAGVKSIGPFHKCFSSVVGPNGSGKSNVIDAMLFVFGKRAKKLRLNKVSELIHSSDAYKTCPLKYARVSVYFQEINDTGSGDEDFTIVPDSEIVVTRIAKRDNSSNYKLNGKNCSFRQVALYLDSKGIDLDNNRFLILQGEVEMISMMPPKGKTENDEGLLEYLEDIIGSNKYVADTNEAASKVEALTDQWQEKLNRVKAVEKEKDSLEDAKLEAEALLNQEREIRRKKNILYQIYKMEAALDKETLLEKKEVLEAKLQEERVKLEAANERVAEIENGISSQTAEYEKAHLELVKTKEEFAAYERKDIQLREEIKHAKANKKKFESKIKSESKKEQDAITKGQNTQEKIPELQEKLEALSLRKVKADEKLEAIFEESKDETEQLRQQLEVKTKELAPITQERAEFQAALDTAMTEVKLLEDTTTRAKEQVAAAEKELASLDSTQEKKRTSLAKAEDELAESKERVVEAQSEDTELAKQEKVLAKHHAEMIARAEEAKTSLQSGVTRSKAVTGILRATRDGQELSKVGVLGRLGDLAVISEQYDVAVSTACGMLDHIVVQTTAGAQRCLDFLRKHNLGRANFIPLDKMKKGAHDRAVETPEGAPRLFDLITPSNFAITPALYLGVGNTLVAPDLETATRWAYDFGKRWRVVTADGSLIELSGTMQGGGKSVQRGRMKLSNQRMSSSSAMASLGDATRDDCEKLEQLAMKAMNDLKECRSNRRSLAEESRYLNKQMKSLTVQIPKLSMEIASCDTTREELSNRLPSLRGQCSLSAGDAVKLAELNKNVRKRKTEMGSCALQASKLETEVSKIQKAILDAGGAKLKKQQGKCDKILSDINETTKEINTAKVLISSSEKAVTKAKKAKETAEEDFEKSKTQLEEKKGLFKALEEEAFGVMQAFEEVKEIESEKKKALKEVSTECDALKKSQTQIKCKEVDISAKLESCEKSVSDNANRMKHWDNERNKILRAEEDDDDYDSEESDGEENDEEKRAIDEEMKDVDDTDGNEKPKKKECLLPTLPHNALEQYSQEEVKQDILRLDKERQEMAKNANMAAIEEYRKKEGDYLSRISELDAVSKERSEANHTHEELRRKRLDMFMEGFGQITLKLKEMYQMITLGGDAELELVDSMDPFSEGIVFSVRPPKKSWKDISNLSGGEKTLSSLALVFALHHYKPTPLYVMDEIDAALDFKNVSIVANYIKERTKNAQFIIISLRNNMFELADRLVGIYKTQNCTKSITIDPKAFSKRGFSSSTPFNDRTNANLNSMRENDKSNITAKRKLPTSQS